MSTIHTRLHGTVHGEDGLHIRKVVVYILTKQSPTSDKGRFFRSEVWLEAKNWHEIWNMKCKESL